MQQRRRRGEPREVRLSRREEMPVDDVAERGQHVAAQLIQADRGRQERGVHEHRAEHDEQRGEESTCPPRPEGGQVDSVRALPFAEQQAGDEETRQHEEGVEREDAAGGEVARVDADRDPDRETTPPIEGGPVGTLAVAGSGHVTTRGSAAHWFWMEYPTVAVAFKTRTIEDHGDGPRPVTRHRIAHTGERIRRWRATATC